jgi:hypothetical protein
MPDGCCGHFFTESIEWFTEDQAFLRWFGFCPPPSSPLSRQQLVSLPQSSSVSPVEFTDGRGGGGEKARHSIIHLILSVVFFNNKGLVTWECWRCPWSPPWRPPCPFASRGSREGRWWDLRFAAYSYIRLNIVLLMFWYHMLPTLTNPRFYIKCWISLVFFSHFVQQGGFTQNHKVTCFKDFTVSRVN